MIQAAKRELVITDQGDGRFDITVKNAEETPSEIYIPMLATAIDFFARHADIPYTDVLNAVALLMDSCNPIITEEK